MADNTIVKYSGAYVRNSTGGTAGGATLTVYAAGTSTLSSIFTDNALTVASNNPITADSAGLLPFAYKGTGDYKVVLKDSGGATLDSEDNVTGALDTSTFGAATYAIPDTNVQTKSTDYVMLAADVGTVINANCTGTTVQITLLSSVTVTNGRGVTIRHTGTSGQVKILTSSSQTITSPKTGVTTTAFALVNYGESVDLVADGAGWHVKGYVPPLMTPNTPGVIIITDRVSAAPSSPTAGARYIVTAAYSTFEQEDIIEADGQGTWIEYTPPTDCGWIAYVQDENLNYQFVDSAWVIQLKQISSLTEDTNPDGTSDYVASYDASGATALKVLHANLPGALLGLMEERQASGTGPASISSGAWATATLNTETYDRLSILSISANQFTISTAGTYEIEWSRPYYGTGKMQSRLYDVTGAASVELGTQGGWTGGTGAADFDSHGHARVTISASNIYRIEQYASGGSGGASFSTPGTTEIYTRVIIRRG